MILEILEAINRLTINTYYGILVLSQCVLSSVLSTPCSPISLLFGRPAVASRDLICSSKNFSRVFSTNDERLIDLTSFTYS